MRVFLHPAVRVLGLSLSLPVIAAAQGAQACEVDEGRPNQVARAKLAFEMALGTQDPATAAKQLSQAVRYLTDKGDQIPNQVGRHFVLGKSLVLWASQPNVGLVVQRGQLGFATDPQGQVDLVAAIDSSFKVVEAAHPECVVETARFRGSKPWVDLINMAIERMNADANDSARVLATKATQLNPLAPYGYVVLGNVSQKAGQGAEAFKLYAQAIEAAKRDTNYDDARRQAQLYLGLLAADSAEASSEAAAKTRYATAARGAFQALLADKEAGEFGRNARDGMCRVSIAIGDTASLRQTYSPVLATPAQFAFDDLMSAGICLARADMLKEAAIALRGAYEKNAYHRDAVSNLAIMYLRQDQFEQALPLAQRLSTIEPNNQEGIELLMLAYAGIAKRAGEQRKAGTPATGTKARPAQGPRLSAAALDSLFKIEKAYTDSAFRANAMKTGLTSQVALTGFSTKDGEAALRGTITGTGVAECANGTYDPEVKKCRLADGKAVDGKSAEGDYILTVEFLDATGKVVATQDSEPLSVRANASSRFNVTVKGTGITSFRYRLRRAA